MQFDFSAGGVVFNKDSGLKVLLIQPEDTTRPEGWSLPKGHIEKGEKSDVAALREVKEETGIDAEIVKKIDDIGYFFKSTWEGQKGELIKKKVSFYLMRYTGGEPVPQKGETEGVAWFKPEVALAQMAYKTEKEILEKALKIIEHEA